MSHRYHNPLVILGKGDRKAYVTFIINGSPGQEDFVWEYCKTRVLLAMVQLKYTIELGM
jgi:hypothetical protein